MIGCCWYKMTGGRLAIFCLFSVLCEIYGKDHVPVLIWNTKQVQEGVPAVSALQYINYGTFQAKYLAAFKPKNILLFLQDALSVEDLSSHASEFQHVRQWMEKSHALYLPNVENAAHLAHDLPSHGYNVVVLEPGVPAAGLDLKQEDNNLVVVKLPTTLTNPSRRRALQKADEVMQNVISKVGEKREFTVIFTGLKPSVEDHSEQYEDRIRVRVSRSLKAYYDDWPIGFHVGGCTMLYLHTNMTINYFRDNDTDTPYRTDIIDESKSSTNGTGDCTNRATIVIKYTDITIGDDHHAKASFEFTFQRKNLVWEFSSVESFSNTSIVYTLVSPDISGIPLGMSYSCTQKIYLRSNDTGSSISELVLNGIQMEPFSSNLGKFSNAWDCIGFFTVPIWASLLVTLLLVTILSVGMYMLSNIKTMDRFDDPKGQPIMVPATAE